MTEAMAFLILGIWGLVALGASMVAHAAERKEWQAERKDLLNRIMANNYQQYADAQRQTLALDKPMTVVGVEELVTRLQEQEREMLPVGMPV